jgi:hypothetical protein
VLLLVCAAILWFHLRQRPAVAVAAGLIGLGGSGYVALGTTRKSFVIHYLPDRDDVGDGTTRPFKW